MAPPPQVWAAVAAATGVAVSPRPAEIEAALGGVAAAPIGAFAARHFPAKWMLIMVGVGLETMKQIESQLMQRNYEGFPK